MEQNIAPFRRIRAKVVQTVAQKTSLIGLRIPRDYFVTSGKGESDITIHAGSYHLALKDAGIERYNIMTYSSIMSEIATEVQRPTGQVHGAVLETISAAANAEKGQRATAGIIYGWLREKSTGKRRGGLVCEYHGEKTAEDAEAELRMSLNELYTNGFDGDYDLVDERVTMESIVPSKKFGTALVAICFLNHVVPVIG